MLKNKKLALKLGIKTYQILTNYDEVCIPTLSSILLFSCKLPKIFFSSETLPCSFVDSTLKDLILLSGKNKN